MVPDRSSFVDVTVGSVVATSVTNSDQWPISFAPSYTTQPFYGPFSGTIRVSRCQKRTSGLYGASED